MNSTRRSIIICLVLSTTMLLGRASALHADDDIELSLMLLAGGAVGAVVLGSSPFWAPPMLLQDEGMPGYFAQYPYQTDHPGYLMPLKRELSTNMIGFRLSGDFASNFRGSHRSRTHAFVDTSWRLGVDVDHSYLRTNSLNSDRNDWQLGTSNLMYRFAQSENAQFRVGFGVNWLETDTSSEVGVNFTYAFDIYPIKPVVLSTEFDWGRVGTDALLRVRSTAGLQFRGLELYSGVDFTDLGKMNNVVFIGGVRVWF